MPEHGDYDDFKTWIACFKGVDLPIGDLAEDVLRDPDFPDGASFGEILSHIESKSRNDYKIMECFAQVWSYYLSSR